MTGDVKSTLSRRHRWQRGESVVGYILCGVVTALAVNAVNTLEGRDHLAGDISDIPKCSSLSVSPNAQQETVTIQGTQYRVIEDGNHRWLCL